MAITIALINLFLCIFRHKLSVAISIIDTTADFLAASKRMILVDILYALELLAFCLVSTAAIVHM
jgi:hypothetical protein